MSFFSLQIISFLGRKFKRETQPYFVSEYLHSLSIINSGTCCGKKKTHLSISLRPFRPLLGNIILKKCWTSIFIFCLIFFFFFFVNDFIIEHQQYTICLSQNLIIRSLSDHQARNPMLYWRPLVIFMRISFISYMFKLQKIRCRLLNLCILSKYASGSFQVACTHDYPRIVVV